MQVTDKRGRTWELFHDISYYGMYCVRFINDRKFNSQTSFHFITKNEAEIFIKLLEKSS